MFARFELSVSFKGNRIFKGDFMSINKLIKAACCFSDDCVFYAYDHLTDKSYTNSLIFNIMEEFKHGEIYL